MMAGCVPAEPQADPQASASGQASLQPSRTLRLVLRADPLSLAGTNLTPTARYEVAERVIFNAGLALQDGQWNIHEWELRS
jgi:hypothetical protein